MEIDDKIVQSFKSKMHITNKKEDSYLKDLLQNSVNAIAEITGDDSLDDTGFLELVMERSRYAYNDQLEYFLENFQQSLMDQSLKNYTVESGGADEDSVQTSEG